MRVIVDRNTAVRAVCELLDLPYETRETVRGGLEYIPMNDAIIFDFATASGITGGYQPEKSQMGNPPGNE